MTAREEKASIGVIRFNLDGTYNFETTDKEMPMMKTLDLSIESHAAALLVACKDRYLRWEFMSASHQRAAKRKVERIISMYLGAHGLGLQPEPLAKAEASEGSSFP